MITTTSDEALAFRDWLIPRMIASIEKHETQEHKRLGCLEGVELLRNLNTPAAFEATLAQRRQQEIEIVQNLTVDRQSVDVDAYWRYRCATYQIEFMFDHLRIVWQIGSDIVSAHALSDLWQFQQRN